MLSHPFTLLMVAAGHAAAQNFGDCGTQDPPAFLLQPVVDQRRQIAFTGAANYTINTYIHVITTAAAADDYPRSLVDAQMDALNTAYADYGFAFNTSAVDYYVNDTWAFCYDPLELQGCQYEFQSILRQGGYADLNIYFLSDLHDRSGILGVATFPEQAPTEDIITADGTMILAATLPGSGDEGFEEYQLGVTAIHEVGHWLGLFHTFQGFSCEGEGDYVDDTPQQLTNNFLCDAVLDSCPDLPGGDPIHNYMDYTVDECKTGFTAGQAVRMQSLFAQLRLSL